MNQSFDNDSENQEVLLTSNNWKTKLFILLIIIYE